MRHIFDLATLAEEALTMFETMDDPWVNQVQQMAIVQPSDSREAHPLHRITHIEQIS